MNTIPDLDCIRAAHERIKPYIHRTPVLTNATINEMSGATVYFKCENFQKAGAFKTRGACNAVFSLSDEEAAHGVVTHSSGNHAAALARAAMIRGIPAYIVMPRNSPAIKKAAVEHYGGRITLCEPTVQSREEIGKQVMEETGATLVHPFDDYRIIAGQATAAIELFEEQNDLDYLLAPVGGGGMICGSALAVKGLGLDTTVIACEPEKADDAYRSFQSNRIEVNEKADTIADGLRTNLSGRTFEIIRKYVSDIVTVSEEEIELAMRTVWERMKIIIEPSSAVAVAPVLFKKIAAEGKRVGVILTGGNVDLELRR
jgi:threonine dehydratase